MARQKRLDFILTIVSVVYLAGLWIHQLPECSVKQGLETLFRPLQSVMLTDRLYRMYAPDPRATKRIPFLELRTDLSPVRFLKNPPGTIGSLGLFPVLSHEKWQNFMDNLGKSLAREPFFFAPEAGAVMFQKLALRICKEESGLGDRVRTVTFKSRRVFYGEFRGDIVWDEPQVLESLTCP